MIQKLALPSALFLFMLGGCSTLQQPTAAPAPAPAPQAVVVDDGYRQKVDQHLNSVDQALSTLDSRNQAAQNLIGELGRKLELLTTELRTELRQTRASQGEVQQQMERLSAQLQLHQANHAMELQAEIADLAERIEDGEAQLEDVISQIVDLDTAMTEKAAEAAARLDVLEAAAPKAQAN